MRIVLDRYRSRYRALVRAELVRLAATPLITEADLLHLPLLVQRYLRYVGAVGKPQVYNFRAVFTADFRQRPKSPWMKCRAEQYNWVDQPRRFFYMKASSFGPPMEGLHLFGPEGATFQVKVASLLQVVDAKGPELTRTETVTLFNDLCLLAPAAFLDRQRIQWEEIDSHTVRASFTHLDNTITATLSFAEDGQLTNFVSEDRLYSEDGNTFKHCSWSTPVREYQDFGGRKIASNVETVWQLPEGEFTYGKFQLQKIAYNVREST